jgi:hypothetical protein
MRCSILSSSAAEFTSADAGQHSPRIKKKVPGRPPTIYKWKRKCVNMSFWKFSEWPATLEIREDWMIHRGPSFLAVFWFSSTPCLRPLYLQHVSLSQSSCVSPVQLTDGGGREGGGGGAESNGSYDRKKAWASFQSSLMEIILSCIFLSTSYPTDLQNIFF